VEGFPRRNQVEKLTPAELAIREAVCVVELAGCDTRLTDAVNLLAQARDKVADFVDGVAPKSDSKAPPKPPETLDEVENWLRSRLCYGKRDKVLIDRLDGRVRARLWTTTNVYSISAIATRKREIPGSKVLENYTYLGCVAGKRAPRPGEEHTRGSDLPDGDLSDALLDEIMNAIVRYEALEIPKREPTKSIPAGVCLGGGDHSFPDHSFPECACCGKPIDEKMVSRIALAKKGGAVKTEEYHERCYRFVADAVDATAPSQ
jgi:hypothetical protein